MKRVGILLQSTNCSKQLYETVHELYECNQVEIFYLVNCQTPSQQGLWEKIKARIGTVRPNQILDKILFKSIIAAENRIMSRLSKSVREQNGLFNLDNFEGVKRISLKPIFSPSGIVVRYSDEDIDKIRELNLDIIIRGNAQRILKGKILNAAQEGIISFHHGDNRWNRGGPLGFWEVYLRKDYTGYTIQILTEELDGGSVIFRGNVATKPTYAENVVELLNSSNPHLARLIVQYAQTGRLPEPEVQVPYGASLLMTPTSLQSIAYLLKTLSIFLSLFVNKLLLRKRLRWNVAFVKSAWRYAILRKGIVIQNPPGRFLADPFVIRKDERTICYVEDYYYASKRACVTAVEIFENNKYRILGPVIQEPFHLSFPYLFEYDDDLYMVPESLDSNSVRLYKCLEFPSKWLYVKDIMSEVRVVDTMIFKDDNRWWLLCNKALAEDDKCGVMLMAYYSDDPLTDNWHAHQLNPLIVDDEIARNGGILEVTSSHPVRVRQKQGFNLYGKGMSMASITELSPSSYAETEIAQIYPHFFKAISGCHHMHSDGQYTVYDYVKLERIT
ncbi:MAG: hypothetical protein AAF702_45170 [Chloroflexota bacterium]